MKKTEKITNILNGYQYKNTPNGVLVYIDTADGKETVPIKSELFFSIVAHEYQMNNQGKTASQKEIKDAILSFQGNILLNQRKQGNALRIQMEDDGSVIRINKADGKNHYFKVTARGWTEQTDGENYFAADSMLSALPNPADDAEVEDVYRIFKYCRIPESQKDLFIAYLAGCFLDIIHPCLVLQGVAGSSKTTVSTLIKMLIDPSRNNAPCIFPDNEFKMKDIYSHAYLVAYDNLDRLNKKQSDMLCSIVTGAQYVTRKLYTDSEACVYDLKQPIILNGIGGLVSRDDLLDRSIIIELPPISSSERKSEKALMKEYEKDLPYIFGGILEILSETLRTYKADTVPNPPRMIDFYEYGYYICEALENGRGEDFCEEYNYTLSHQKSYLSKEDEIFLEIFLAFVDNCSESTIKDTSSRLYTRLSDFVDEYCDIQDFEFLPGSAAWLSKKLRYMKSIFEDKGVFVEFSTNNMNCSVITIHQVDPLGRRA